MLEVYEDVVLVVFGLVERLFLFGRAKTGSVS